MVIHHHLLVFPVLFPTRSGLEGWPAWLTYTPLHLLWAGGESVLFFFLLSGFVLSLPFWRGEPLDMVNFVVRRWWRVWVPYMVAVSVAAVLAWQRGHAPVIGTSVWYENIWKEATTASFVQHVLMLGHMDEGLSQWAFLPVVWSLKWEMWLSLLPVVLLLARQHTLLVLALCPALLWAPSSVGGNDLIVNVLRDLAMFVLGAWLARERGKITALVIRLPSAVKALALLGALLLIPAQWYGWQSDFGPLRRILDDVATLLASAVLISLALGWAGFRAGLERPLLSWLGRISYSLYLYHTLVITLVVRLGAEQLPLPWLLLISFVLSVPVTHLAHRWVEVPALARARKAKAVVAVQAA